ncbi:MAG: SurA N-terminal domain-containing protein [Victivallaceae bacterium]|nr:SurA N-terminal domain-containing protein [Victivallaceae bacterium]
MTVFRQMAMVVVAAALASASGEETRQEYNSILASVNGEPISLMDVLPRTQAREYQLGSVYKGEELEKKVREVRREAVDDIINRKLVVADYRKGQIRIPESDIEGQIEEAAAKYGARTRRSFEEKLKAAGTTMEQFRKEIEETMIYQMMIFREQHIHSKLTPKEVFEYYRANLAEFTTGERVELGMILLDKRRPDYDLAVQDISESLCQSPSLFDEMVARYSPDSADGGSIGMLDVRRLRKEFANVICDFDEGLAFGPIETPDGTAFLRIRKHVPERTAPFKEVQKQVREKMEKKSRQEIADSYIARLRRTAVIRYHFDE